MPFSLASIGLANSCFCSSNIIVPEDGLKFPAIILIRVDLPAPLSPINPKTSPGYNSRLTSSKALIAPKLFEILFNCKIDINPLSAQSLT